MPKVSVVIASYNHAPFVHESVMSVLQQSFQDVEVVITDDGSTDGTPEIIHSISDSRIHLNVLPRNMGACVAMNDAISRSTGKYIAVLNSDDYFLSQKLEKQVIYLDRHSEIGAVFGLPQFVNEEGKFLSSRTHSFRNLFSAENRTREQWLQHLFFNGNCLCHPTVMIRRECYNTVGLYNPLLRQLPDLDMWVRICQCYQIHIMSEQLTAFRVLNNEGNTSAQTPENEARHAWETQWILKHYLTIDEPEILHIFDDQIKSITKKPLTGKLALAELAISINQPGYALFGLQLLHNLIEENDTLASYVNSYFSYVGALDPCGVAAKKRSYLAHNSLLRFIQRGFRDICKKISYLR